MQKILVIQTAFIGDVVLATALIEKLHGFYPNASIDFLVRKGNEGLLKDHPYLHAVLVWDKKQSKLPNLWRMGRHIRAQHYDMVVNVQRFAATGLLTAFSGAKERIGFDKNPLSMFFTRVIPHVVSNPAGPPFHEIDRNQWLIREWTDDQPAKPRLYPSAADEAAVQHYKQGRFITVSPASVWFTKQYPREKWADFIRQIPVGNTVYILGAPSDKELGDWIKTAAETPGAQNAPTGTGKPQPEPAAAAGWQPQSEPATGTGKPQSKPAAATGWQPQSEPATVASSTGGPSIVNLCGQLSFLQSAALMKGAAMNYVNDSAPMHFASAVNAPVTAVYCSTIPAFGFGPLSDDRHIVEIEEPLDCRPCGLHGYKVCPRGHFNCAHKIQDRQLLQTLINSRTTAF